MEAVLNAAIETLIHKAENGDKDEAMRFTQAALNLAHVKATLATIPPSL